MFDSVLGRGAQPSRVYFRGAVASVAVHVAVLGFGVYLSMHKPKAIAKPIAPMVLLKTPLPLPAPPPAPPAHANTAPEVRANHPIKKPNTFVEMEKPEPLEEQNPAPTPGPSTEHEEPGTGASGMGSGTGSGTGTGSGSGTSTCGGPGQAACAPAGGETVLPFIPGMLHPTLLEGEKVPTPSREAIMAKVEGMIIASCTITTTGSVTHCRILKGLPYMDDVILSNLQARKYTPITYQGHPVSVEYKFPFRIVAP